MGCVQPKKNQICIYTKNETKTKLSGEIKDPLIKKHRKTNSLSSLQVRNTFNKMPTTINHTDKLKQEEKNTLFLSEHKPNENNEYSQNIDDTYNLKVFKSSKTSQTQEDTYKFKALKSFHTKNFQFNRMINMNIEANLEIDTNEQIFPIALKKSHTSFSAISDVNNSALSIMKYYKDQTPPTDTKPYTDDFFPPNIDSLIPKKKRLCSFITGFTEEYVSSLLHKSFGFVTKEICWYRASEIFPRGRYAVFQDSIEVDDILQGNVGNCYFMSSIAAMSSNPQLIMELFRTLSVTPNGCYEVVMKIDGIWQIILLDDYFPCHKDTKKPLFAQ